MWGLVQLLFLTLCTGRSHGPPHLYIWSPWGHVGPGRREPQDTDGENLPQAMQLGGNSGSRCCPHSQVISQAPL